MRPKSRFIFISILLLGGIFLYGCSQQITSDKLDKEGSSKAQDNEVVCNPPYIRYANECCLDQNSNSVCDSDEKQLEETNLETTQTQLTQQPQGNTNVQSCREVPYRYTISYDGLRDNEYDWREQDNTIYPTMYVEVKNLENRQGTFTVKFAWKWSGGRREKEQQVTMGPNSEETVSTIFTHSGSSDYEWLEPQITPPTYNQC